MKRIIIYTDGATLEAVRLGDNGNEPVHLTGDPDRVTTRTGAGEGSDFVELKGPPFGRHSSIRGVAAGIGEIVHEERVDLWHLVAPPDVKEQLGPILDDPVQRRLSPIGFGELVAVAGSCASSTFESSSCQDAGGLQ